MARSELESVMVERWAKPDAAVPFGSHYEDLATEAAYVVLDRVIAREGAEGYWQYGGESGEVPIGEEWIRGLEAAAVDAARNAIDEFLAPAVIRAVLASIASAPPELVAASRQLRSDLAEA